jgi:hypothetical protein
LEEKGKENDRASTSVKTEDIRKSIESCWKRGLVGGKGERESNGRG